MELGGEKILHTPKPHQGRHNPHLHIAGVIFHSTAAPGRCLYIRKQPGGGISAVWGEKYEKGKRKKGKCKRKKKKRERKDKKREKKRKWEVKG